MSIRSVFYFCFLLIITLFSYQFYQVNLVSHSSKSYGTKKGPVHVLIISTWRSGSSFIGQIFNHHPDVFYLFEPGHSVWMRFRDKGAKLLHYVVRDLIRSLFTCDVMPLELHVSGGRHIGRLSFFAESRALCSPPSCSHPIPTEGYDRSKCFLQCKNSTFDKMAEACHTYNYRVMKTVRILDFSILLPLFRDPALDLRIIHLVRDPRAIASSRKYFDLRVDDQIVLRDRDKDTKNSVMTTICKAQADINRRVKAAGPYLQRRYMLIRHEDLSREPIANVKKMYEFSGLKMTPDLEKWIYNITHVNDNSHSKFMPFSRHSLKVIQKWRKILNFKKIKEVEEYCKEAMDLFGYLPVGSQSDQKNMNIDFVLWPVEVENPSEEGLHAHN